MSEVKQKHANNEAILFCDFVVEKEASGLSKKSIDNCKDVYARFVREAEIKAEHITKNAQLDGKQIVYEMKQEANKEIQEM